MKDDKAREEARKFFKQRMGSRVTEMPDGTLTGAVDPEVAIDWATQCFGHLIFAEHREYKGADELTLDELEAPAHRLTLLVKGLKVQREFKRASPPQQ